MSKIKLNLLILVALIGIGLSAYLTYQHFHILIHGVKENSFCSFNEKFDCDSVGMSEYAKIGPFPVAGLGLLYFVYLLGALLYARFIPDASRKCLTLPFLLTLPGIALCLYLIYVSSFILKTYCIFCMGLSTMTLLTVILLPTAMGLSFTEIGSYFINSIKNIFKIGSGNIIYALAVGGLGLLLLGGYESKYASDFEDFDQKAYLDFFYLQKPIELNPTGRPLWGKENAP
ncbi:MAG: hypothetical protein JNK65_05635, partial [Deltaproteobacteria bacterium]|nr:hypothetical protein [Deltaproteobacteria bacterium]